MISLDVFWLHLIKAKEQKIPEHIDYQSLHYSILEGFSKKPSKQDLFKITFQKSGDYSNTLDLYNNLLFAEFDEIPNDLVSYIRLYVPLLMASRLKPSRPLIITHFAQSLDGKICTSSGKSKWISNEDNLNHSHRLRAMVDAVMVGGGTIKADKPKLTVRRVKGNNPKRIFWCNSIHDYSSYHAHDTFTILIADKDIIKRKPKGIDHHISYSKENQPIKEVLAKLKDFGVSSIFIEGGSITLSNFYEAQLIDLMQIHIAPVIFGSGKCAFEMAPIDEVSESLKLDGFFSTSDNHILYHGKPIYNV